MWMGHPGVVRPTRCDGRPPHRMTESGLAASWSCRAKPKRCGEWGWGVGDRDIGFAENRGPFQHHRELA